jgi:hypothetical protein
MMDDTSAARPGKVKIVPDGETYRVREATPQDEYISKWDALLPFVIEQRQPGEKEWVEVGRISWWEPGGTILISLD